MTPRRRASRVSIETYARTGLLVPGLGDEERVALEGGVSQALATIWPLSLIAVALLDLV